MLAIWVVGVGVLAHQFTGVIESLLFNFSGRDNSRGGPRGFVPFIDPDMSRLTSSGLVLVRPETNNFRFFSRSSSRERPAYVGRTLQLSVMSVPATCVWTLRSVLHRRGPSSLVARPVVRETFQVREVEVRHPVPLY